ncbi:MAG TPA: FecR domain-containing protein [Verrucomicrobiota bacterium]|nr:FecR domain-containing protein [Verrucomicrobiota bacterium]
MTPPRELIYAYLDGEASVEQQEQLRAWLQADPANVRAFVEEVQLNQLLRAEFLTQATRAAAVETAGEIKSDALVLGSTPAPGVADGALAVRVGRVESSAANLQSRATPSARARTATPGAGVLPNAIAWFRLRRPLHFLALAASVTLMIGLSLWFFPATHNEPTLTILPGTQVALERAGQSLPASDGMKLLPGDLLRISGSNGAAITCGKEATRVVFDDQAELKILPWSKGKRLELRQGKVQATAARQRLWSPMILVTAEAEARVLGTQFSLNATTNATRLDVTEGRVQFTRRSDEAAVKVGAGNYAVATANHDLSALPFTGSIRREWWSEVSAGSLNDIRSEPRYPGHPSGVDAAPALELKPIETNQFAVRFCGYVHPPVTGDYEFWLAGGTQAVLFMSPSEDPAEKVTIAVNRDASQSLDQPRFRGGSPWAPPTPLVAGRRYYVEALVFVGHGEGHLSVAWKIPGQERQPLTGEYLSPFKPK